MGPLTRSWSALALSLLACTTRGREPTQNTIDVLLFDLQASQYDSTSGAWLTCGIAFGWSFAHIPDHDTSVTLRADLMRIVWRPGANTARRDTSIEVFPIFLHRVFDSVTVVMPAIADSVNGTLAAPDSAIGPWRCTGRFPMATARDFAGADLLNKAVVGTWLAHRIASEVITLPPN